jgi:P4 family phage/plasmid primase-like protien
MQNNQAAPDIESGFSSGLHSGFSDSDDTETLVPKQASLQLDDVLGAFFPDEQEPINLRLLDCKTLNGKELPKHLQRGVYNVKSSRFHLKEKGFDIQALQGANKRQGVYFVVNAGGNSDKDITRFNAYFVENDTLPINEQNERLNNAPLPPSIRIQTNKSIHAYWLISGDCTAQEWREMQRRLIAYFDGDNNICNPSRPMRLPFFDHVRYDENAAQYIYKPVEVKVFEPIRRYTLQEMQAAFPALKNERAASATTIQSIQEINSIFSTGCETNPQEAQELAEKCLQYLSLERCDNRNSWRDVGYALHNTFNGNEKGLELWREWSKKSPKYTEGCCETIWHSSKRETGEKITVGSLIHWAREDSVEFCEFLEKHTQERRVKNLAAKAHEIQLTDYGNAQRLVALYGQNIRYDYRRKTWFAWNGKCWQENAEAKVMQYAKATAKAMYSEASKLQDDARRQPLAKHAVKSESANSIKAMVKLAESEPEIQADISEFDSHPHLLNVDNGVINLRNGKLLPHTREMMLSNYVPVEYNPNADCPIFKAFLERIFAANTNLIGCVQRAIGYTVTGETSEQGFFLCYGEGANGKSTLLETMHFLMKDLAGTIRAEALMQHKFTSHSGHNEDVASLRGKRFVSAVETESGHQLAESLIKQLTGGDTITASRKYGHSFSFKPQFKLWIAANHKPQISGTDEGIWRRINFIPFNIRIPEDERDKQLKDKLQSEAQGILTWIVRGAVNWYAQGLGKTDEIRLATTAYRNEQDSVANFLCECCDVGDGFTTKPSILFDNYKNFCAENGYTPLNQQEFPRRLGQLGYSKSANRIWRGIKIKPQVVCPALSEVAIIQTSNFGSLSVV